MNRVVWITGANGGLGLAMAKSWLESDPAVKVWMGVRAKRDKASEVAQAYPERARCVDLDVTSPEAWAEALKTILEVDGRVDVLVNNAGHHDDTLLGNMTLSQWDQVVDSNLKGCFLGCQTVCKTMMSQRFGRIINVSSLSALLSPLGQANYAAAKAGILGLTQSFSKEVARFSVTVNAICPGYIETEALAEMDADAKRQAIMKVPMRRLGKPEEVANLVRFLGSEQASYITGSTIKIDGGIF